MKGPLISTRKMGRTGFEPVKAKPEDLQSSPVGHLGICPITARDEPAVASCEGYASCRVMKMLFCGKTLLRRAIMLPCQPSQRLLWATENISAKSVSPNSARKRTSNRPRSSAVLVSAKTELPLPLMSESRTSGCFRNQPLTIGSHGYFEKAGGSRSLRRVKSAKARPVSP